jgi:hypothetical protein
MGRMGFWDSGSEHAVCCESPLLHTIPLMIGVLCYLCCHKGRLNLTSVWYSACLVVTVYR